LPGTPQTRSQLLYRVVVQAIMVALFFGFGVYQRGHDQSQKAIDQAAWPQMFCTVTVVGRGYSRTSFKISYAYNYEGRDYTSTRYSTRSAEMPQEVASNLPSIAYVNPQNPSESVLSVAPLPTFGINRFELLAAIILLRLTWDTFRLIRGY
jgi:hypothetical protein